MMTEMPVGIAVINSFIVDYDVIFGAVAASTPATSAPPAAAAAVATT
jgi:hypothetical protein